MHCYGHVSEIKYFELFNRQIEKLLMYKVNRTQSIFLFTFKQAKQNTSAGLLSWQFVLHCPVGFFFLKKNFIYEISQNLHNIIFKTTLTGQVSWGWRTCILNLKPEIYSILSPWQKSKKQAKISKAVHLFVRYRHNSELEILVKGVFQPFTLLHC